MDRDLVERAQRGDRDAFTGLVHAVGDRLYALAYRILREPDLAKDACQEALIAAWRQLPGLRDADHFDAWIYRILVHACYAESRKRTRWSATIRVLEVEVSTPSDGRLAIHDRDEIERAFRSLPIDQRTVFVLRHHLGLPLVEIAETLGIPAGTARSRLHYATQALRRSIDEVVDTSTSKERSA